MTEWKQGEKNEGKRGEGLRKGNGKREKGREERKEKGEVEEGKGRGRERGGEESGEQEMERKEEEGVAKCAAEEGCGEEAGALWSVGHMRKKVENLGNAAAQLSPCTTAAARRSGPRMSGNAPCASTTNSRIDLALAPVPAAILASHHYSATSNSYTNSAPYGHSDSCLVPLVVSTQLLTSPQGILPTCGRFHRARAYLPAHHHIHTMAPSFHRRAL